jgi:hypothetical protein
LPRKIKMPRPAAFCLSLPAIIGLAVAALYVALLPTVNRAWRSTGDEPHYLLAAHSLVMDQDFDLSNNYDRLDYLDFYISRNLDRQIRTNQAGQQILNHQVGYPLLIAPAYALGGRFGVLLFQAMLGGLLAALTFKLAAAVSEDDRAALAGTLAVSLAPPLFFYPFLVYPELPAALLTTGLLYGGVTRRRAALVEITLAVPALAALPWLSRRFVPLALALALLLMWAWRKPATSRIRFSLNSYVLPGLYPGLFGLMAVLLSTAALAWFSAGLTAPLRADITAPVDASMFWTRLGRGAGWLVDQQRGLLVFAPVMGLALWGVSPLLRRDRRWVVFLPLLLSLAVTTLAGGFWTPWELGPRFLVVGLPALAGPLALAWRRFSHRPGWLALAAAAALVSAANTVVIFKNPDIAYKSSLPIYYGERLGLPLTNLLPAMAGYARIRPSAGQFDAHLGRWVVPAGGAVNLARSGPLIELPYGWYRLLWPLRVEPNLPPDTPVARLSINALGRGAVFHRTLTAADLPANGAETVLALPFFNPNPDRWQNSMALNAVSAGFSRLWSGDIVLTPHPLNGWILPYGYGFGLLVVAWLGRRGASPAEFQPSGPARLPAWVGWAALLALVLAAGWLGYRHKQPIQTYNAVALPHRTGHLVADSAARAGQVWQVDPQTDPPQTAVNGPFDIFDQGQYYITFRLQMMELADPGLELARLRVVGAASAAPLFTQPLRGSHFTQPGLYHDFVLRVSNPRRQALSFEVEYLAAAALAIDQISIAAVE